MRRREFIGLLGSATAAWPLMARSQQSPTPVIGFLGPGTRSSHTQTLDAFLQRLHEFGWFEGKNLTVEYRFADGRPDRFADAFGRDLRLDLQSRLEKSWRN